MEITDRKIIWGLIVLQLIVCLPFINSFPIALDEPFSIFYAQQEIGELMNLFKTENNPPLHFILLHFWIKLFGISPLAVRSLSLIFSLYTIFIIYKFGRLVLNQKASILVVLLFIFSRFNHYHALEARTYSLLIAAYCTAMYSLYKILIKKDVSFKSIFLLAVSNAVLLYSHYISSLIIGSQLVILVLFLKNHRITDLLKLLVSYIITLILYSPGLYLFIVRLKHFNNEGTWVPTPEYSELYGNIIRFFNNTFTFVVLSLFLLYFILKNRQVVYRKMYDFFKNKGYQFVFVSFFIPYIGMFIFSKIFQPIFLDRYLIFTSVFLYFTFVIIYDFVFIEAKYRLLYFIVLIPMIVSVKFIPENNREPDNIARFIHERETPESIVVICPPFYDLTFQYHYDNSSFKNYKTILKKQQKGKIQPVYSYADLSLTSFTDKVFFVDANSKFLFPENDIEEKLTENMKLIERKDFAGEYKVWIFKND